MKYRHYKGGEYEFICLAFQDNGMINLGGERTIETMVVYRALADGTTWVRPAREFFGPREETMRGVAVFSPRFTPLLPKKE